MPFHRRNPNTDYGPGSNWWEDPDAQHALNDYGAAVSGLPVEERPPFAVDDWRDPTGQPTTPDWARDDLPDPFPGEPPGRVWKPVCVCGTPGCAGAYGGRCQQARDPYEAGGWG